MKFFTSAAAVLATFSLAAAQSQIDANPQQPTQSPASGVTLRTFTPLGCFNDPGDMWDMGPYTYQTNGWCQPLCVRQGAAYFALVNGTNCFCGNSKPGSSASVSSSECDTTCNGFSSQNCGGTNRWAVYADNFRSGDETGTIQITTPTQTWFSAHSATNHASTMQTVTSPNAVTVTASSTNTASATPQQSSGGPNKAAIAAGAVAGVLGLAALIGALVFFVRQKKKRELDDERRRHESIMRIVNPEKGSGSFTSADQRLEPSVMFQRRQSDGSIMDNEDYSRRILKVANPDWRASRA